MKQEALSPGSFVKILNSMFQSINMGVDHELLLQLFLIGFCFLFFFLENWKKISIEISFNLRLLLRLLAQFSYTYRQSSANPPLLLV